MDQSAPKLTKNAKILSFDVESNGLHGEAFAAGAVLITLQGEIVDEFNGRCPIKGEVDDWVKENVLPAMKDMPENYGSTKELRGAFWQWYKQAKEQADLVVVKNSYPVETRFLAACQDDDLEARYWDHPFPLIDLASMFLQAGIKPLAVTYKLVEEKLEGQNLQHHPRWDAWVTALAAIEALKLSGRFS